MTITLHHDDLPAEVLAQWEKLPSIAVDTETMGLQIGRDRLCLIQLCSPTGEVHLVQFRNGYDAPNLKALLANSNITKLFHFARFDLASIQRYLGVVATPVFCTKIASRLVRTYTDKHGLKELVREQLGMELSKQQQSSDWGAAQLSPEQLTYAASDVLHLHGLRDRLQAMLVRENRLDIADACFSFLASRVELDLQGWSDQDIFAH
ncbi:MAG: ribonuclease D [Holosporaceae bacterium]|jgi:ribonuclease D|nr:ribonuclease D [Rhodospirillaceae bacterium]